MRETCEREERLMQQAVIALAICLGVVGVASASLLLVILYLEGRA